MVSGSTQSCVQVLVFVIVFSMLSNCCGYLKDFFFFFPLYIDIDDSGLVDVYDRQCNV